VWPERAAWPRQFFGIPASSSLVIGAVVGSRWDPPRALTGLLLAFASGALISPLAFELFEEAFRLGGAVRSGLALLVGARVFLFSSSVLDRYAAGDTDPNREDVPGNTVRERMGWRCWRP
jgi:zinc transporter, ZIP family